MSQRKKAKELPGSTGGDRIGALPDEVLHHVLSFLPAQEAVQTCLLARRWLHLWKSATGLRIGEDDIYLRCVKDQKEFLNRLLLLRDGAPLDTCVLRFRWLVWFRDEGLDDTVRVNHWFRHALLHKVRFLLLDVDICYHSPFLMDEMPLVSRHLTRLQLKNIGLNNSFLNFSSCPALEHLVFESCKFDCAKISSSSAKRLSIADSYFSETSRVRIAIPSLVSLQLDYFHGRTPVLETMPSLLDAFVRVLYWTKDYCIWSDSGDCGHENCESCYGIKDNNCVLLEGLSEAKTLGLISEHGSFLVLRKSRFWKKMKMTRMKRRKMRMKTRTLMKTLLKTKMKTLTKANMKTKTMKTKTKTMTMKTKTKTKTKMKMKMKSKRKRKRKMRRAAPLAYPYPCNAGAARSTLWSVSGGRGEAAGGDVGSLVLTLTALAPAVLATLGGEGWRRGDARNLFDGMSPRKMPKESPGSTGGDRIGDLPDEVLHHVLSFLPAQEAVRTCLLARRWLHLWKSATGLRIGEDCDYLGSVKKQKEFLDRLLLLRDGAPLDTCVLMFDYYGDMDIEDTARVNLWFRHALIHKARFLWLDVGYYHSFVIDEMPLVSQHLTRLQLRNIRVNDSFLNFSSCPALEHLVFQSCKFGCAKISSSSAKRLSITNSYFSEISRVRIAIPSLVSLQLDGFHDRAPVLERMPSLVDAFVGVLNWTKDYCIWSDSGDCGHENCESCYGIKDNNCVLLEGLSEAKTLGLISERGSFILKRDLKWCPTFTKLKTLLLNEYWCVPDDFSALTCILQHAPVLENLILQICSKEIEILEGYDNDQDEVEEDEDEDSHEDEDENEDSYGDPYEDEDDDEDGDEVEEENGGADARRLFGGMSARKEAKGSAGGDRIGALPDEVLHRVLSFLPAQDAVRTCVLAPRWRHLWKSATGLRVGEDESNLGSVKEQQEFLDHLLVLRDSAPLETCVLRFNWYDDDDFEDIFRLNVWFRYAIHRKVRFLRLDVWQEEEFGNPVPIDEQPIVSQHLTRLQLYGIVLNDGLLDFSSCPSLEHLVFESRVFECAKISSNSVKHLSITFSNFPAGTSRVRIDIPSLVSLRLDRIYDRKPVLERMPSLVDAFVSVPSSSEDFCGESDSGDCGRDGCESCYGFTNKNCVLLEGLSEAKMLVLINEDESFIFKRDLKWCPTFSKLKTLILNGYWCVPDDSHMLARILEHSPALEKLVFQLGYQAYKRTNKIKGILNPMERSAGISEHLQIVEVQCNAIDGQISVWRKRRLRSANARGLFDEMPTGKEGMEEPLPTDADHIGALPDTVLHHVLSFLPSQDAVRTCVLAKRWLDLWKSVTALRIGDRDKRKLWTVKGLQGFVDHFLLLRESVPLHTCVLRFIVFSEDLNETSRLNLWIKHALLRMVQFLQVSIRQNTAFYHQINLGILPFVSRHLSMLELHGVRMVGSFLDFSRCPALQHLEFDRCELPCDKILSESLKLLRITRCKFSQTSRVRICVPSLVSLRLDDFYRRTPVLERMPSLVEAFVRVVHRTYDCCGYDYINSGDCGNEHCKSCHGIKDDNNCVLLDGLSEAKTLALIDGTISFIFNRDLKWCPTFSKLKTLLLNEYWCVPDEFSALACILEHAPVLENLILQLYSEGPKHTMKIKGNCHPMDRSAAISGHLETVEIRCEVVDKRVLKVLKYLSTFNILLSKSRFLKKMTVMTMTKRMRKMMMTTFMERRRKRKKRMTKMKMIDAPPFDYSEVQRARRLFDGMPPAKRGRRMMDLDGGGGEDRVGALPDEVLHHMLSFLPARDAVQTCVLAHRWRDLWKSATGLRIGSDEEDTARVREIRVFVDHLLLLRGCAPLDMCELKFWFDSDEDDDEEDEESKNDARRMNLWIRSAVASKVRNLVLNNICSGSFELDDLPLVSRHLTRLELFNLELTNRFCNFSSCPALEHVKIANSTVSCPRIFSSSTGSLLRLIITRCSFVVGTSFRTKICVPSLVSLQLDSNSKTPLLESMPSLAEATVRVTAGCSDVCGNADSGYCGFEDCKYCYPIDDNRNCVLLNGLSEAKNLALTAECKTFIFKRDLQWCPTFSKLKTLLLNDHWCVAPDFHALSCILKHSPVLEKLTLHLFSKGPEHKVELNGSFGLMDRPTGISERLNIVEVKCKVVDENVSKVLKFLCACNIPEPYLSCASERPRAHSLFDGMPPAKRSKKDQAGGEDRIGALPDEIPHHMLSFLPARDAVQTCVLAGRWRHLWKSATGLRIGGESEDWVWWRVEEKPRVRDIREFVDHLLLLRGCEPLDMCELRFWSDYYDDDDETRRVNLWIRHAVASQVRHLVVRSIAGGVFELDDLPLVSRHLTRLELFKLDLTDRFCNFSSCSALKHLKISDSMISCPMISSSAGSLQQLSISHCSFGAVRNFRTRICVPSLVSLQLDDYWCMTPLLESMPSLVEATITVNSGCSDFCRNAGSGYCGFEDCNYCYPINDDRSCVLLKGLSEAKNLALVAHCRTFIFNRDLKWYPTFSKLKTLLLNDHWCVAPEFHALSCILKHSPVLEKLTLHLFSWGPGHKVEMNGSFGMMDRPAEIPEHLNIVEVKCGEVNENVSKVLKFLIQFLEGVDKFWTVDRFTITGLFINCNGGIKFDVTKLPCLVHIELASARRPFDGMPPAKRGKEGGSGRRRRPHRRAAGRTRTSTHVLSFLPARDAVQTCRCVLARRWRELWKSATAGPEDWGRRRRRRRRRRREMARVQDMMEFMDHLFLLRGLRAGAARHARAQVLV
uniref:F-box domain-containing protein n=1 Tax=Oryza rufipogon TaxID=4529 RepID=A0A0E0R5E7_ORYRU